MEDFFFYNPTKFVFGRGKENEAGGLCKSLGARKVLVVYGGGSAVRSGLLDRVKRSLDEVGLSHVGLGGVRPNPTDDKVYEGIALCREAGAELLLAVGGGSVIDTAKAIAAGVPYEGDFWDFYCGKSVPAKALPVGVVLTIPAAGSEGSGNSVITKLDGLRKLSLRTAEVLRPKFAVMNPELTFTLPAWQTACGVADMMSHILERYFSNTEGVEVTDRLCEGTLKAIVKEAPLVMSRPDDYDARANIMWCGTIAHNGICGVGRKEDWSVHALEHELSALYDVTHGAGLAVIYPAWMTWMVSRNPHKIAQLAKRVFGVSTLEGEKAAAKEGIGKLKDFFRSLGLPVTMGELGIESPDIDLLVRKLGENKGTVIGSYYPLRAADWAEIYQLSM